MEVLKVKALDNETTSQELTGTGFAVRFISFEATIRMFSEEYNIEEKPCGYRVTNQGIEILYK